MKVVDLLTISEVNKLKLEFEEKLQVEKSQIDALESDFENFKKEIMKRKK
ncbi:MAG: hypothetical protein M3P28_07425 [Thermoproteota archaeon]|nr:hypothetical protein [Thermoproteota archaeon]